MSTETTAPITAAEQGLPRDLDGDHYRTDDLGPWKVTACCGAYVKGMSDGVACRGCHQSMDGFLDGPARLALAPTAQQAELIQAARALAHLIETTIPATTLDYRIEDTRRALAVLLGTVNRGTVVWTADAVARRAASEG